MKCPKCGSEDAYLGMFDVDCPNPNCVHYKGNATPTAAPPPPNPAPVPPPAQPLPLPARRPGPPGGGVAVKTLTVKILSKTPKLNSVELEFICDGDPGFPDKKVQFQFWIPGIQPNKMLCTLSNRNRHMVTGVDANGTTIYKTHWKCTQDGVAPTDSWELEANIFP